MGAASAVRPVISGSNFCWSSPPGRLLSQAPPAAPAPMHWTQGVTSPATVCCHWRAAIAARRATPCLSRDASTLPSRHWRPGWARGSRLHRGHHPGLRLRSTRAVHGVAQRRPRAGLYGRRGRGRPRHGRDRCQPDPRHLVGREPAPLTRVCPSSTPPPPRFACRAFGPTRRGGLAGRFSRSRGPAGATGGSGPGPADPPRRPPSHHRRLVARVSRKRPVSPYAPRGTALTAVPLVQRSSVRSALQPAKSTS